MQTCWRWLGTAAPLARAACQSAAFDPRRPVGLPETIILIDSRVIVLAIVVPSIGATLVLAWWLRASYKEPRHLPKWAFSGSIEHVV